MSFILVPNCGEDVQINAWNWRPTLELLRDASLLEGEAYERMSAQGCGGCADAALAALFADAVDQKLTTMHEGDRMLADLSVTDRPKTGRLDDAEIYSATFAWLTTFSSFCRRSGGFYVS